MDIVVVVVFVVAAFAVVEALENAVELDSSEDVTVIMLVAVDCVDKLDAEDVDIVDVVDVDCDDTFDDKDVDNVSLNISKNQ